MQKEYGSFKTAAQARDKAHEDLMPLFMKFCQETFGEENVKEIGQGMLGFRIGTVIDKDGFEKDFCAAIKIISKRYNDSENKYGFDLDEAAEEWEEEKQCAREEKLEKCKKRGDTIGLANYRR